MDHPRYSLPQRLIHWTVAVFVVGGLSLGLVLGAYGFDGLKEAYGIGVTNLVYKYHKTFGVIILALMTVRLLVRLTQGKPDYDPPITRFEASASRAVHALLYAALLVQPVLGWAATASGGFPIEFFNWTLPGLIGKDKALSETLYEIHGSGGWLILVLVVLHLGGALMHWLIKRDTVMKRMSF